MRVIRPTMTVGCVLVLVGVSACGSDDAAVEERVARERAEAARIAKSEAKIAQLENALTEARRDADGDAAIRRLEERLRDLRAGTDSAPAPETPDEVPSAEDPRVPVSGSYSGMAAQRGSRDRDYAVEMSFSSAGSTVDYPGLGCSGKLIPAGFKRDRRVYRENITRGACDDAGTWLVLVQSADRLSADYLPPSGRYTVTTAMSRR